MQLLIRKSDLQAAFACSATKDIRYYLTGVYIEFAPNEDGGILIFAGTNGGVLFCGTAPAVFSEGEQPAPFWMTIPADAVKAAIKSKTQCVYLTSLPDGRYTLADTVFAPVDAKYPDFRRVLPDKVSGELAQYDPALLLQANTALNHYYQTKNKTYRLNHGGNSAGVMSANGKDACVVVMPIVIESELYAGMNIPAMPEAKAA